MTSHFTPEQEAQPDFYTMPAGLARLKNISGLAQMVFAVLMLIIDHYFIQEQAVVLACMAMFAFGFILVGVRNQNLISPSRKLIKITRGFFFITYTEIFAHYDVERIQVILKTHIGTDSNGIGPTQHQKTIFTYYVQVVLKKGTIKTILTGSDKTEMEAFSQKVATALNVPVQGV